MGGEVFLNLFQDIHHSSVAQFIYYAVECFSAFSPLPAVEYVIFGLGIKAVFHQALLHFVLYLFDTTVCGIFPDKILHLFYHRIDDFVTYFPVLAKLFRMATAIFSLS